jgi:hypothetical protein
MTAISVAPTTQPGAAPPPPDTEAAHATASFAEVLAKAKERQQAQHRAYSFAELGMFGLHAAQFAADLRNEQQASARVLLPSSAPQATADVSDPEPQAWIAVQMSNRAEAVHPSVPAIDGVPPRQTNAPTVLGANVSGGTAAASGSFAGSTAETSGAPKGAAAGAAPKSLSAPLPQHRRHPVQVVVSGADDALKVAVRSDGEGAPAKLRRLVETTVTQFEMHIAELHINGSSGFGAQPVFSPGGFNGGRAR